MALRAQSKINSLKAPEHVNFRSFLRQFKWQRGEHVTIIGPTGSGKSTLALALANRREYVVLFLVKPEDDTMTDFIENNEYYETTKWEDIIEDHIALWPRFVNIDSSAKQRQVFRNAINGAKRNKGIFAQGDWTIVIDETSYMVRTLGLEPELNMLWQMGRAKGISVVAEAQRPKGVPQLMLSQATHVFFFQVGDAGDDLDRISEIGGTRKGEVKAIVPQLDAHEFVYNNTRTGQLVRSKV